MWMTGRLCRKTQKREKAPDGTPGDLTGEKTRRGGFKGTKKRGTVGVKPCGAVQLNGPELKAKERLVGDETARKLLAIKKKTTQGRSGKGLTGGELVVGKQVVVLTPHQGEGVGKNSLLETT